jgi:hypothetical protein
MRVRTLEIRWHDSKPISSCDFQPVFFKKARPVPDKAFAGQSYRLATGGEDNHVRVRIKFSRPPGAPVLNCSKALDGLSEYNPSLSRRGSCE